jgi:hypothetical protein
VMGSATLTTLAPPGHVAVYAKGRGTGRMIAVAHISSAR